MHAAHYQPIEWGDYACTLLISILY